MTKPKPPELRKSGPKGGRPKKEPDEKVKRIAIYVSPSVFEALAKRATELKIKAEDDEARVRIYARVALEGLAARLDAGGAQKS
jgi:hypothetical protein